MHGYSFRRLWVAMFCSSLLITPLLTHAGTLYRCVDKEGNVYLSDYPLAGKTCRPSGSFKEMTKEEKARSEQEEESRRLREQTEAAENEKSKTSENLRACLEQARIRRSECGGYYLGMDPAFANGVMMQCEESLRQEREKCLQQYPQRP